MGNFSSAQPLLVIVSGRPGAGKSTLARRMSVAVRCPLVARDDIYEGMVHTLGIGRDVDAERAAMKRCYDTFFVVIRMLLEAGSAVIAEAAFQDAKWQAGLEPVLPWADIRVVQCVIETGAARDRVVARLREEGRGHPDLGSDSSIVRPFTPLSLPVPTLEVSAIDGYEPSFEEIVAFAAEPRQ